MNRRRFLYVGASTGTIGLLAGCLGGASTDDPADTSTAEPTDESEPTPSPTDSPGNATDDQETESDDEPITTPDDDEETTGSNGDSRTSTPEEGAGTPESGTAEQAWSAGGETNGVAFEFTSRAPECGQGEDDAEIDFQPDAGRIVVEGIRYGSDLCKRAQLGDVSHDTEADRLAVSIETVERESCEEGVGGQCIVDIPCEAIFSFEGDIPTEIAVSHGDRFGAGAAYGSASASPPEE